MSKTIDQIRRENGVRWRDVWNKLGTFPSIRLRDRKLKCGLSKKDLIDAAFRKGPLAGPFTEAALCEVLCRAAKGLQTDIEDFCPTTQVKQSDDAPKAA